MTKFLLSSILSSVRYRGALRTSSIIEKSKKLSKNVSCTSDTFSTLVYAFSTRNGKIQREQKKNSCNGQAKTARSTAKSCPFAMCLAPGMFFAVWPRLYSQEKSLGTLLFAAEPQFDSL